MSGDKVKPNDREALFLELGQLVGQMTQLKGIEEELQGFVNEATKGRLSIELKILEVHEKIEASK